MLLKDVKKNELFVIGSLDTDSTIWRMAYVAGTSEARSCLVYPAYAKHDVGWVDVDPFYRTEYMDALAEVTVVRVTITPFVAPARGEIDATKEARGECTI